MALRDGGLARCGGAIFASCRVRVSNSRRTDIDYENAGLGGESCVGSAALAASGMMNIFRRDGGRQVDTGTYDADKSERLRLIGEALQRQMRRRVEEHKLQSNHTRAPASELYWAVVALLVDDGLVNANVLRREAPDKRTLGLVEKGKQSVCDPFWVAKLRAEALWVSNTSAPLLVASAQSTSRMNH